MFHHKLQVGWDLWALLIAPNYAVCKGEEDLNSVWRLFGKTCVFKHLATKKNAESPNYQFVCTSLSGGVTKILTLQIIGPWLMVHERRKKASTSFYIWKMPISCDFTRHNRGEQIVFSRTSLLGPPDLLNSFKAPKSIYVSVFEVLTFYDFKICTNSLKLPILSFWCFAWFQIVCHRMPQNMFVPHFLTPNRPF